MVRDSHVASTAADISLDPFVQRVALSLVDELPELVDDLVQRIVQSDPFYARVAETMTDEIRRSSEANLGQLLRGLAGFEPLDFEMPRRLAQARAEKGVPVAALLHAYRLAAELVWERVVEAGRTWGREAFELEEVLDGTVLMWTLTSHYSSIISQAYGDTVAERIRRSERERTLLLDALFDGRALDEPLLGDVAHNLDLPDNGTFVVVVAENPATGQEALADIEQRLRILGTRTAWRLDMDRQTGVVALHGPARRDLTAEAVREWLEPMAVARAGISPVFHELADTARHVLLADLARRSVPPGEKAVACYDARPVETLVAASPTTAARSARLVLGAVLDLPADERANLLLTLKAWISCRGSVARAAELGFCHRNTVRNRLTRVEQLTGRSLTDPATVTEICVAITALRLLGDSPPV